MRSGDERDNLRFRSPVLRLTLTTTIMRLILAHWQPHDQCALPSKIKKCIGFASLDGAQEREKSMSGQIDVIVTVDVPMSAEEKVRGAFPSPRNASRITHVSLEAAIVEAGLREMIDKLGDVFLAPPAATRNFEVDEIELSLAIDAKGSVSLIGSVEVGGHAGIKVKLKRKTAEK